MKEIYIQILPGGIINPFSEEDKEIVRGYKPYQTIIANFKSVGAKKQRSLDQLKMFWACANTVAQNTDDPMWNTKEKVAFQIKVALHFVNPNLVAVRPDGTVVFSYRSISFKELSHMEACNFFDRAFSIMASKIGVTVDELIDNRDQNF